jgi:hypothetical protein
MQPAAAYTITSFSSQMCAFYYEVIKQYLFTLVKFTSFIPFLHKYLSHSSNTIGRKAIKRMDTCAIHMNNQSIILYYIKITKAFINDS